MKKLIIGVLLSSIMSCKKKDSNTQPFKIVEEPTNKNIELISKKEVKKEFITGKHLLINNILLKTNSVNLYSSYTEENKNILNDNTYKIAELFYNENIKGRTDFSVKVFTKEHIKYAILENIKYNIPASTILAQAYLESKKSGINEFSDHVLKSKNYFGIKDFSKKKNKEYVFTNETYTKKEFKRNKKKIVKVYKQYKYDGVLYYDVRIKDNFRVYNSDWESFRDHSDIIYRLNTYNKLFKFSNDYKKWCNHLGSKKSGGVGYSTTHRLKYGKLLIGIIEKYNLQLLDL